MECAGHKWQLSVCPGGEPEFPTDSPEIKAIKKTGPSLFLKYTGTLPVLKACYSLRVVNQIAGADHTALAATDNFDATANPRGTFTMVRHSQLMSDAAGFKMNDRVVIEAEITTFGKLVTTTEKTPVAAAPVETLKEDLASLLTSGTGADVSITFGTGSRVQAHALILKARSPYFRKVLAAEPLSASSSPAPQPLLQLNETEVEPAVFQEFLKYAYTDSLSEGAAESMGETLMLAANKYGCEALKQLCEDHLCRGLNVENAAVRLVLSDEAEGKELKGACLNFIKDKAAEVTQSTGWQEVKSYRGGALGLELFQAMAGASTVGKSQGDARGEKRPAENILAPTNDKTEEVAAVDDMSVAALRSALAARSLDTSGDKTRLGPRLKAAIQEDTGGSRSSSPIKFQ